VMSDGDSWLSTSTFRCMLFGKMSLLAPLSFSRSQKFAAGSGPFYEATGIFVGILELVL